MLLLLIVKRDLVMNHPQLIKIKHPGKALPTKYIYFHCTSCGADSPIMQFTEYQLEGMIRQTTIHANPAPCFECDKNTTTIEPYKPTILQKLGYRCCYWGVVSIIWLIAIFMWMFK